MSNFDYQAMSDREMLERLESGECQTNAELAAEVIRRVEHGGTSYKNTPEDKARWKADTIKSHEKIMEQMYQQVIQDSRYSIVEGNLTEFLAEAKKMGYYAKYEEKIQQPGSRTYFEIWGWTESTPPNDLDWIVVLFPSSNPA